MYDEKLVKELLGVCNDIKDRIEDCWKREDSDDLKEFGTPEDQYSFYNFTEILKQFK